MFGITSLVEATTLANEPLKIAIVGPPGIGKSWLAATAPGPVFDIDFDGRKSSLFGKKDVVVKTYRDNDPKSIKASAELEADIGLIEYEKTKGNPVPSTYVLDSLTYMKSATENEIIRQQPTLSREIKVGAVKIKIGQGWDIVNGNRAYIEYLIGRLSQLGNLIIICHTQDEKDKTKSTATEKKYTGKITIQPEYMSTILSLFNDVWMLDSDWSGKRFITTGITDNFIGKNSLGLPLKVDVDDPKIPYITQMVEAHQKRIVAANTTTK